MKATKAIRHLAGSMIAPRLQLPVFDEKPLEYTTFISSFEDNVDQVVKSDSDKFARLIQQCTAPAAEALAGCQQLSPTEGYEVAQKRPHDRFGAG